MLELVWVLFVIAVSEIVDICTSYVVIILASSLYIPVMRLETYIFGEDGTFILTNWVTGLLTVMSMYFNYVKMNKSKSLGRMLM